MLIDGVISRTLATPVIDGKQDMHTRTEHSERVRVFYGDRDYLGIRQHPSIQEHENSVLRSAAGSDVLTLTDKGL